VLLTLENLHDWGLRGIRSRQAGLAGGFLSRGVPLRDAFIGDIPIRELDDPPDRDFDNSTASSTGIGIIEELANTENYTYTGGVDTSRSNT